MSKNPDTRDEGYPMAGYERDVHTTAKVLSALAKAMDAHPNLRLGQLLYSIIARDLGVLGFIEMDGAVGNRLFNIYDENIITALQKFDSDSK